MHSKYKIWDFISQNPNTLDLATQGLVAFHIYEPLFKQRIIDNIFFKENRDEFRSLSAKEISIGWVEDNLKSLSLFGNTDSFIITDAQELKEQVKQELLSSELMLEGRYVILVFDKSDKMFVELTKNTEAMSVSIVEHPFWEADKLLDYTAKQFKVKLDFESKEYLLEVVNNTYLDFLNICSQLELNFGTAIVSKEDLNSVIIKNRIDNFEFAKLFGFKQSKLFFKKLKEIDPEYDELRSLFYFLQTHMLKIGSTDHIYKKSKQSKYDKQIIEQSKIWKEKEIELGLKFLKGIEFMAKTKNDLLFNDLKSSYLKTIVG